MRHFLKIVTTLFILFAVSACGSKTDSNKSVEDANNSAEQAKRNADKAAEEARKATEDAVKANESALDATSSGGQPGTVSLSGEIVSEGAPSALDARISVNFRAGLGWRDQRPEVKAGALQLKSQLSDSEVKDLNELSGDKSYINFGCDVTSRNDLTGFEEKPIEHSNSDLSIFKAGVVLLCDGEKLLGNMNLITAETVVLSGFRYEMIGAVEKNLSLSAKDLQIEGDNLIASKGKDGASTLLPGPSVSISAIKVSGDGKLDLSAEGSNYESGPK